MERVFGCLFKPDPRSENYPIRALFTAEHRKPRSYTWKCPIVLDQGNNPACTGFAVSHEAAARPVALKGINNATGIEMYHLAQDNDEFSGNDYAGSTVNGAMKAGRIKGWYTEWRWAKSVEDLAIAVSYFGPAVAGTVWTMGMMEPDEDNYIHFAGPSQGGHAYLINGYSVKRKAFKVHNSWGAGWGLNGEVWIAENDIKQLIETEGEFAIPLKRLNPKAK